MLRRLADPLQRILGALPPASGAVVMGTGIVSVGLSLDGRETLSRILLVITAIAWVILAVLLAARVSRDPIRVHQEARSPAGLTGVAGTEVLGTRMTLLGWTWVGIALLIIGLVLWLVLLWPVLANWVVPTFGGSFVLAVATESLAVLSATVAAAQHARWLAVAALVPFVLGLAFYLFVIRRFDFRQLLVGHGDHWITGGALAIATLAIARITLAADSLHTLTGAIGTLEELTIVLWVLSIAWIPVLMIAEVARPRPGYDVRRWATVFPIGMYAACSGLGGSAAHASAMTDFARVLVWIALAVWLVVFVAMLRRGVELVRGERT